MPRKKLRKVKGARKRSVPAPGRPATKIPRPSTVVEVLKLESPKGREYKVVRTTQKDPYDPPEGGAA